MTFTVLGSCLLGRYFTKTTHSLCPFHMDEFINEKNASKTFCSSTPIFHYVLLLGLRIIVLQGIKRGVYCYLGFLFFFFFPFSQIGSKQRSV